MAAQVETAVRQVPHSYLAGVSALVLALGLHGVAALQGGANPVQQAGGNTALAARGNSFANMAAGIETPQQAETPVEQPQASTPQAVPPVQPPVQSPVMTPAEVPTDASVAKPMPVSPPVTEPLDIAAQIEVVPGGVPLVPALAEPVAAPRPDPAVPEPVMDPATLPEPKTAVTPTAEVQTVQPQPADQPQAQQVLPDQDTPPEPQQTEPQQPESQSPAVTRSLRPPERPQERPVEQPKPAARQVAKPVTKAAPTAKPRGNGQANATRGDVNSTRTAPGGQAAKTQGTAQVQGNAAASNYKGLVMRRIQRAKRRANVRGVAFVRFKISASGALAGVSIARSSGSGKLDGIALAQVRRSAPFPPPPAGARTSYTVRIEGN